MTNDDQSEKIRLWYEGIGAAFSRTRGLMAQYGCQDSLNQRLIYYGVSFLVSVLYIIIAFNIAYKVHDIIVLSMICYLTGILVFIRAFILLKSIFQARNAVYHNKNIDLNDPIRLKAINRAFKWAKKKKYIKINSEGVYEIDLSKI